MSTRDESTSYMTYSRHIAAVLGPALVVVTLSEAIHLGRWIWEDVHPTVVYLNGLLFLIGGLVIATTHNIWGLDWRGLVTPSGWLLVLAGAYRMFAPEGQQLSPGPATYATIALLGCLGLALSWFAFLTSRTPSHSPDNRRRGSGLYFLPNQRPE